MLTLHHNEEGKSKFVDFQKACISGGFCQTIRPASEPTMPVVPAFYTWHVTLSAAVNRSFFVPPRVILAYPWTQNFSKSRECPFRDLPTWNQTTRRRFFFFFPLFFISRDIYFCFFASLWRHNDGRKIKASSSRGPPSNVSSLRKAGISSQVLGSYSSNK